MQATKGVLTADLSLKMHQKRLADGLESAGELTALPQTPWLDLSGRA